MMVVIFIRAVQLNFKNVSIVTFINCTFLNNSVSGSVNIGSRGGAVAVTDSIVAITKCIFSNNYVEGSKNSYNIDYGGALMVNHSLITIRESIFSNNAIRGSDLGYSHRRGGAIYAEDSDMIIDGFFTTSFVSNFAEDVSQF